jgi:hypothetical protein
LPYNVLLLPLLGGYFFLICWNCTKFNTSRQSGHKLIFHAAAAGLLFLGIAFGVVAFIISRWPHCAVWWQSIVPFPYLGTSLLACVLGMALPWPLNFIPFFRKEESAQRAIERANDHLEILLARACRETKAVSITLKSRKVYIGLVTRTHDPTYDRKYIQLLPIKSGFRDSVTQAMTLTVDYSVAFAKIIQEDATVAAGGIRDFEIVIPVSEIQSVNLFDPTTYLLFNPTAVTSGSLQSNEETNAL